MEVHLAKVHACARYKGWDEQYKFAHLEANLIQDVCSASEISIP